MHKGDRQRSIFKGEKHDILIIDKKARNTDNEQFKIHIYIYTYI